MRWLRTIVVSLAMLAMACSSPFPCTRYCWSHKQHVPDVTGDDGVPDGHFDDTCTTFAGQPNWNPPLPPVGWYGAEICLPADEHQIIAETVAALEDPTVDASQACDVTDIQTYMALVQALAVQAREACVQHLTCKRAPGGCDIDPSSPGDQACTILTAETLCDAVVLAPALAALSDLSNGPGAAQPQRDGTRLVYVADPQSCEPLLHDTEGTPPCDGGGNGSGADETATSDGGADESTSGGDMLGPFGDVAGLVACTSSTRCVVDPELFRTVQANLWVFHDDGVRLEPASVPSLGWGVRLTGVDRGEPTAALLDTLGLAPGDVITHVDGAPLGAPKTVERLLLELPAAPSWRLTVSRATGAKVETFEQWIVRGP